MRLWSVSIRKILNKRETAKTVFQRTRYFKILRPYDPVFGNLSHKHRHPAGGILLRLINQTVLSLTALALLLSASAAFSAPRYIIIFIADGWVTTRFKPRTTGTAKASFFQAYPVRSSLATFSADALRELSEGYSPDSLALDFIT
jgi:hypothetical protein